MSIQAAYDSARGVETSDASTEALMRCIKRLEDIIEAETLVLKNWGPADFDALNQRKTHALLEFLQVSRTASPKAIKHAAPRIQNLRGLLSENAQLLERRLQATQEITELIVSHLRQSDSDGTYSIRSTGVGPK